MARNSNPLNHFFPAATKVRTEASMKPFLGVLGATLALASFSAAPAASQAIESAYTKFDAEKNCRHRPGRDVEDYGSWACPGHDGIGVHLSAGDQRMQVSFGRTARKAHDEPAGGQSFPGFNNVYEGTVEWRLEPRPNGKKRPFATILRWNVREAEQEGVVASSGRVLVVTRLGPGGVCHVGYVDARANPNANELARQIADNHARKFDCTKDKPVVLGQVSAGINMPTRE
jgi:hypothetical protein